MSLCACYVLALVDDLTVRGDKNSAYHIKNSRLSGSVASDHSCDTAFFHRKADIVHGLESAEILRQILVRVPAPTEDSLR